jgi:diketogulonate reductase-like aldo/keto reductase
MSRRLESVLAPAADGVDPALVPKRKLFTGAQIPAIGLGTFGSDHVSPQRMAEAVEGAITVGYRHLDCGSVYGNEDRIGEVLERFFKSGLRREELWITSKLWNDQHGESDVIPSCRKSIADLKCEYLDAYLVHWPFPNFHPAGCSVESRSPDSKPYIHGQFMTTWRQMEALVDMGLAWHIGTSNMTIPKLELLLRDARIKPAVNEMELHPHFQQPELFDYVRTRGIQPIGYSPLGSPARPERDRTPEDTVDMDDPVITGIARRLGVHPALVCIKWAIQRGQIPIPQSANRANYLANLRAAISEPLTSADMQSIAAIDRNCRLIKGQVFLWKSNQRWEDLWDLDGLIAQ